MKTDAYWMWRALALSRKALGQTFPNPLVGAIVLDARGNKVGEGFHEKAGLPHAEINALEMAGSKAKGGTLFLTMEPCTHQGKTGPCVKRVLESGIQRVVIASLDPNPKIHGKGLKAIKNSQVDVAFGCLEAPAKEINRPFEKWIQTELPFVTAKVAMSLDGKIGIRSRRLILSGQTAEKTTMRLRAESQAILVGVGTVLTDDPLLTVRGPYSDRKPSRVILDEKLDIPLTRKILTSREGGPVWIACHEKMEGSPKAKELKKTGAELLPLSIDASGKISIPSLLKDLAQKGIGSLLVEGGAKTFQRFRKAKSIDRWVIYLTPKILGEKMDGEVPVSLDLGGPFSLTYHSVIRRGEDCEIWARPK